MPGRPDCVVSAESILVFVSLPAAQAASSRTREIAMIENADVYNLWDEQEKPHHKENNVQEYEQLNWDSVRCVYNITEPTLSVFKAFRTTLLFPAKPPSSRVQVSPWFDAVAAPPLNVLP